MSSRDWTFRIQDILTCIEKIERYIAGMTMAEFKKKEITIDAVVRNFEIIGEASKHIPVSVRNKYPDVPWNEMAGIRNVLIHEYFGVDVKILWSTAKKDLASLKKQLIQIPLEKS
jgi:uncharacterized protein with HEPN domain